MTETPGEDPFESWRRRRSSGGTGASLIDLYEAVARARGLAADQLAIEERERIWTRALPVMDPGYQVLPNSGRAEIERIEIVPYDDQWPGRFEAWKERLLVSGLAPRRIDHIGSTAVPGLQAKPVIDVQVSVDDVTDERHYVPAIESVGVQLRSRDDQHRYFRPFADRPRDVHIHVCNLGSEWERRHLLFRDYLRADASARDAYLSAKQDAAARWSDDGIAYTESKSEVIEALTAKAEVWAHQSGWALA
jgi:GrpB-like predicted nucleotidyltransferase (UPF0157 family)